MKMTLIRRTVTVCCQWLLVLAMGIASASHAATAKPQISSPADTTPYSGSTQTFSWTANDVSVSAFALTLGSSVGASDVHDSGRLDASTLSHTVTGLGSVSTLYIRLWHRSTAGSWGYSDSTAIASSAASAPSVYAPAAGAAFSGSSQQLRWQSNGTAVSRYWLYVGSTRGGRDYLSRNMDTATEHLLTDLPTDGSQVYVRLWYYRNGWRYSDHQYAAFNANSTDPIAIFPSLIEPENEGLLLHSETTLRWQNNNFVPSNYWIYVGTSVGGADIKSSGALGTANQYLLQDIPRDEASIYIRLWYYAAGQGWNYSDYNFSSKLYGGPQIIAPQPGTTLEQQQSFDWIDNGQRVQSYQLLLGTAEGASDIYDSGTLDRDATSAAIDNIPQTGQTLHLTLRYRIRGSWFEDNYRYQSLASNGFYEPFDADISRWSSVRGNWYNADLQRLATDVDDNWSLAVYSGQTFSDFDYSARVRRMQASDQPVFLSIRGNGASQSDDCWCAGDNCYAFEISSTQNYGVWSCTNSAWEPLVSPTFSAAINSGSAWNELRVVAEAEELSFYINDQRVWQGSDTAHSSGLVGIGLVNHDDSDIHTLEVEWAQLKLLGATENLAANGSATQSSTGFGGDASRAIDGDQDGNYNNDSTTHTGYQNQPWWQVDLGVQARLEALQIYNREDCCSTRLRELHVFSASTDMRLRSLAQLLSDNTVSHALISGTLQRSTSLALSGTARFIRLQLDGTEYLSLAEVEVMGR